MSPSEMDLTAVIVAGKEHGTDLMHWPEAPRAALDRLIALLKSPGAEPVARQPGTLDGARFQAAEAAYREAESAYFGDSNLALKAAILTYIGAPPAPREEATLTALADEWEEMPGTADRVRVYRECARQLRAALRSETAAPSTLEKVCDDCGCPKSVHFKGGCDDCIRSGSQTTCSGYAPSTMEKRP